MSLAFELCSDEMGFEVISSLGEFLEALQNKNFELEKLTLENTELIKKLYIGEAVCIFLIYCLGANDCVGKIVLLTAKLDR